jgi:DNA-binding SARP family transcriptional activator
LANSERWRQPLTVDHREGRSNVEFSVGSLPRRPIRRVAVRQAGGGERPIAQGRLLSDLFDALPTAILVVSEGRRIVTWNPALATLLGDRLERAATCCEVLGCGTPGGALEHTCVTDLAVARSPSATEYLIELPESAQPVAVAPRVVPGAREKTVLLQIRPVQQPATAAPIPLPASRSRITIRTLGETVVETADGEVQGGWLDQRTGRLLKYLVANRSAAVHADTIAEALWPRARTDSTNTVRHYVHALREKLEPDRSRYGRSAFVVARNGGYQLNLERVEIDAEDFEREAHAGLSSLESGDHERGLERLQAAMDLYRGDFLLDDRYDDWAIAERERLLDLAGQALRGLVSGLSDPAQAAIYLERLAEMEPLDADVQRELIRVWLRQGRRTRAMRRYRTLQSRLMREFGERVTFDLSELARGEPADPFGPRT